jgi:hypothetical protein
MAISLENKAKCPKPGHAAETLKSLSKIGDAFFCLNLLGVAKSVAIRRERTRSFQSGGRGFAGL